MLVGTTINEDALAGSTGIVALVTLNSACAMDLL